MKAVGDNLLLNSVSKRAKCFYLHDFSLSLSLHLCLCLFPSLSHTRTPTFMHSHILSLLSFISSSLISSWLMFKHLGEDDF